MPQHRLTISKIELYPMDLSLKDAFTIASGQMVVTETLFVRVTLQGGQEGYGEIAPFFQVSGENRESSLAIAKQMAAFLLGKRADHYRALANTCKEMAPDAPAARCGLEMAILDALCHGLAIPFWALWGAGDVRPRESDITIPITDGEQTLRLARHWYDQGFRSLKMKVGRDVDQDVRRLSVLHRNLPGVTFVVDPNQGFSLEQAVVFAKECEGVGAKVTLYEQPLPREDLEGQTRLRHALDIPIVADESIRTVEEVRTILEHRAADYVNIKIMKSGVVEAVDMAIAAKAGGLGLMIGGMVETRLAMGCSFGLVLGLGGFDALDLDTPLLMTEDPVIGGFCYQGPCLEPWGTDGLGISMDWDGIPIRFE